MQRKPIEGIAPQERIPEVDLLRGLAVFGMIVWNFRSVSMGNYSIAGRLDYVVCGIISILRIEHTVYPLFSFLFGWGLATQIIRSQSKCAPYASIFLRRLLALMALGIAHYILLYEPDILHMYAMLGVLLPFFVNRSHRTILIAAVLFTGIPVLASALLSKYIPVEFYYGGGMPTKSWAPGDIVQSHYSDMIVSRARDFIRVHANPHTYIEMLPIFGMFLLGLYAARRRVFQDISANTRLMRHALWFSLTLALLGLGWLFTIGRLSFVEATGLAWLSPVDHVLSRKSLQTLIELYSNHALSLFYASLAVLLSQNNTWRRLFRPLAKVGQLALTAYLLHSVMGTTIFYGYGLGLCGKLGCAPGEVLAVFVFIVQAILGNWWLRRFQFGPMEWIWRSLTYGKVYPIRVAAT
jgi:uncharacterized protein